MFKSSRLSPIALWGAVMYSALLASLAPAARADSFSDREARFASGTGTDVFIAAGVLLPLLEDGKDGKNDALRTADALLTSSLFTEALKRIVREPRPRSSDNRTSFPSGHATAAFAVATMESHYHHGQAPYWYLGATLIAASRVQRHAHYAHDVVAGAAVGYLTARYELRSRHGLLLAPFISPGERHGERASMGLQLFKAF